MSTLHSRVVRIDKLDFVQLRRMFAVFEQYYDKVTFERFLADLSAKDDVILLVDDGDVVQGFSTLKNLSVRVGGQEVQGLFSGDTVVAREYWGQRVLGRAFLKYLFLQKARRPFTPYYWFLISKGFKTYLLMANNFEDHHPRPEQPIGTWEKAVLDSFAKTLYRDEYDPTTGLISFPESHGQLRRGVAPITDELRAKYPRIAFFEERNPTWEGGTELACIARMTWSMPLKYTLKAYLKSERVPAALTPAATR
ncbi:MAG TPA: hypothetical protein VM925_19845 [Labilithrix sp.]|nr:hypothetical protein [Labilithrix sp.]